MSFIKKLFKEFRVPKEDEQLPDINIESEINKIKKNELEKDIPPGQKIHSFHFGLLEIRADRDITNHYRITIWQGNKRQFSFTVFAKKEEFEKLTEALIEINDFLKSDQKINSLPKNDLLKGFFYGH